MSKKIFCFALGALLSTLSFSARAQQETKVPKVGVLAAGSPVSFSGRIEALREGLRELGYVEGKSILVDYRYAEGKVERFTDLAAELVRRKVDLIVASGNAGALAAKNATKTIPIVMVGVGIDPVDAGLVESYARPGGNITGFTNLGVETAGKRLELFKETVPKVARVAVPYDPTNRGNLLHVKEVEIAARLLGLTAQFWEVRGSDGFEKLFAALNKQRPDGVYLPGGPLTRANEKRVAAFALKNRLPSMYDSREAVEAGGLVSYAAGTVEPFRRAAVYVDKILKGAKPAELPVEQPTKFELVINLKTAKQIGLTIPPNVLARADRVIK
jgi:putative ABC transport system substrate-binding protein